MDLEFLSTGLPVVVPWSLPEDAHNDQSQSRQLMEKIFKDKARGPFLVTSVTTDVRWFSDFFVLFFNLKLIHQSNSFFLFLFLLFRYRSY